MTCGGRKQTFLQRCRDKDYMPFCVHGIFKASNLRLVLHRKCFAYILQLLAFKSEKLIKDVSKFIKVGETVKLLTEVVSGKCSSQYKNGHQILFNPLIKEVLADS